MSKFGNRVNVDLFGKIEEAKGENGTGVVYSFLRLNIEGGHCVTLFFEEHGLGKRLADAINGVLSPKPSISDTRHPYPVPTNNMFSMTRVNNEVEEGDGA